MADPESRVELESSETLAAPDQDDARSASTADGPVEGREGGPQERSEAERGEQPEGEAIDTWRIGQMLAGRYRLLERLGRGGMSEVYLARHELLKKNVAVKVLRPDIAVTKPALSRFHREAMAAASIGSPHIVDITDYGFTDDGNAFIVMERLKGSDLRTVLSKHGALPTGRCVAIMRQVLRGLAAAHAQGIVHRDLKAENVFLCDRDEQGEFVKVLDFGISKVTQPLDDGADVSMVRTSTGAVMGTPQYIAPEQAHGDRDIDHRVDIYSAGVMLYEMLTGELPFSGKSALDVVMKHIQEAPVPPRQRRIDLDIPPDLDRLVLKAMAKDRADRFTTADEMLAALPEPTTLPGGFASATMSVAPALRRSSWPHLVLVFGLFAAGAAGLLLWVFPPSSGQPGGRVLDATAIAAAARPVEDASAGATVDAAVRVPAPEAGSTRSGDGDLAVPSGGDATTGLSGSAASAPAGDRITLRLEVEPSSARIYEGSVVVATGVLERTVRRGAAPPTFRVRAAGYESQQVQLSTDQSRLRKIVLRPRGGATGTGGRPREPADPKVGKTPSDLHDNPYLNKKR